MVFGNPLVCLGLSFYGLRISLGRQAFSRASYVPDMLRTPAVDVLESAAAHVAERARVIEVMGEPKRSYSNVIHGITSLPVRIPA